MTSTSYRHDDFLRRGNRASLHFPVDDQFRPLYRRDADPQAPAGGVSSSVKDLAAWMQMVLASGKAGDRTVVDGQVLQQTSTPQIVSGPPAAADARTRFYGYGVNVETTSTGRVRWDHSGAFYVGAGTAYALLPAADVGIVAFTNAAPVGAAEAVTTTFTDLVRSRAVERDWLEFYGPIFKSLFVNSSSVAGPPPASPAAARPLSDYVGTYANAYVGDVTVAESGGQLDVTLGPKGLSAPLTHYTGDVFSWLPPGGNGDPQSAVTFSGGPGGKPTTMTVELLQIGELSRR